MKKFILINGLLLISIYNIAAQETGNGLSSLTIETINEAVYEVIVKKNEPIDVTYEKELPMHLIPYAVRNDKYISIGSAFAIESNKYVSAAHVMPIGDGSQYREVFIRDKKGNVFEIDNILNYSDHRDFVVFNLKNKKAAKFLSIDKNPVLNEKVYAVGNALGEGIVIRDGLYTSNTPEQENGEWKWIRFSAAASPGNSGGPLLNKNGKVIGIVCMKSSNENLNYALPIGEALTEKPIAISHKQIKYGLDNMSYSDYDIYHKEFNLPDTYKSLNEKFEKDTKEYTEKILKGMFNKYEKEIFPRGAKSKNLLHSNYSTVFPNIIAQGKDGYWDAFGPSEKGKADLGKNGFIQYGWINEYFLMRIQKPDDMKLRDLYSDSKMFFDLILEGVPISRNVGSDKVRITSMGKADEEYVHVDKYSRKWIVRSWNLEYSDQKIMTFSMPTPAGMVVILRFGSTGAIDFSFIVDTKILVDFLYLSYYGTFQEWKEFLEYKDYLPDVLRKVDFSYKNKKWAKFKSKRLSISYENDMHDIDDKSYLKLVLSYHQDKTDVVWNISGIVIGEHENKGGVFYLYRYISPDKDLSDSYKDEWKKITNEKHPYNKVAFFNEGYTIIQSLHPKYSKNKSPEFAYTVSYGSEGNLDKDLLSKKILKYAASVKIFE